ncbi:MAG TPA: carbonic anhydrase [Caulobacterales bacterium]|nr:carbonic anhydrase [Caulobacterales bacterium]
MDELIEGYRRYRAKRWPELQGLHRVLAERGQSPKTLVIACSDSRVDPATIFDAKPGELFVIRNVANLAPPCEDSKVGHHGTSAAIEFAVTRLKVENILVLGHAQCGGVAHALETSDRDTGSFLDAWVHLLDKAIARLDPHEADPQSALEHESIRVTLENLLTFPFVNSAVAERDLKLVGARYGVADGVLELLDPISGAFTPAI